VILPRDLKLATLRLSIWFNGEKRLPPTSLPLQKA
jgi:hypothetical protein